MIRSAHLIGAVYGGEDKLAMVSPVDIATLIAEEITQQESNNQICYMTSDDRTCNEVAKVLGEALGMTDLKWHILPEGQVLQALTGNGVPENTAMNLVELGRATHTGILREDFDRNKPEAGKITLEDFAKEFAAVYNQ